MRTKGIVTKQVLLLNCDSSVLTTISVKRAIRLYMAGKVSFLKVRTDGRTIHPKLNIGIPSVVCMKGYVHVPFRHIPITRKNVLLRDNFRCQYTNEILTEKNATIDHVIPKSHKKSPGNNWNNLVACTKSINNTKADRTPEEAGLKLLRKPFSPKWEDLILQQKPEWKDFIDELRGLKPAIEEQSVAV